MSAEWLKVYLRPGRELVEVETGGVFSALEPGARVSVYDGHARSYDRLIGNRLYNRLVWGTSIASYASFGAAAVADGQGPLLDIGCGTALFTAESYRCTDRPLVLVDRSIGMLKAAADRLAGADTSRIGFVQADLFDLPFRPGLFATAACHGLLHLFDDPGQVLQVLRSQTAPGGSLYASSLVSETRIGTQWLRLLHWAGESGVPRREEDLSRLARGVLGSDLELRREGSMAFLHASVSA